MILIWRTASAAAILGIFHRHGGASILLFVGGDLPDGHSCDRVYPANKRLPENIMGSAIGLINTGGTLGASVSLVVIGYLVGKPQL